MLGFQDDLNNLTSLAINADIRRIKKFMYLASFHRVVIIVLLPVSSCSSFLGIVVCLLLGRLGLDVERPGWPSEPHKP